MNKIMSIVFAILVGVSSHLISSGLLTATTEYSTKLSIGLCLFGVSVSWLTVFNLKE